MIRASWFVLPSLVLAGCGSGSSTPTTSSKDGAAPAASAGKLKGLIIEDIKVGTGPGAQAGDKLTMHYTGTLKDGTVFDSNESAGKNPFTFQLGAGAVIKGWDKGMLGMKKGGVRKLSIPSDLAYGNRAMGDKIPPNSDLYFDVKMDDIVTREDLEYLIVKDLKLGSGPPAKDGDTVVIDYAATLSDGTKLDSTYERKKPKTFKLGAGQVWPGIEQGVKGMRKGGERTLQVPPSIGPKFPGIPPETVVRYDVVLKDIKH